MIRSVDCRVGRNTLSTVWYIIYSMKEQQFNHLNPSCISIFNKEIMCFFHCNQTVLSPFMNMPRVLEKRDSVVASLNLKPDITSEIQQP